MIQLKEKELRTSRKFLTTRQKVTKCAMSLEEPLKVITAKFPKAKEKLWARFDIKQGRESQLANKIRYQEIWFTWYDNEGVPFEGVCWRFEDIILEKMKNPYWDYEGEDV